MKGILNYRDIGSRLQKLRRQSELTQEQLAENVGVSASFIGHIERGEKPCSIETISRLAICLGTTLDYVILGRQNLCNKQSCALYADLLKLLNAYGNQSI